MALALALARPAVRGARIEGNHVAFVIDSMATRSRSEVPGDRRAHTPSFHEAQHAATEALAALAPGADAFLLEAAREPRLVGPVSRDEQQLRAAVSSLVVREVEGDLASAVALAADRLRALGGKKRLIVLTDGALADPKPLVAAGVDVQVITVGTDEDNAAIVRIDVRAGLDPSTKREQVQVFAMLRNYGARPRDTFVTVAIAGASNTLASRRVLLPANDKTPVVLTFEPSVLDRGQGLVVQLAPSDALPMDDVAYGRVPQGLRMPVTLASSASYSWLHRALESDPNVDLQKLTLAELATVNVDPEALVVIEGACPAVVPGRDLVVMAPPAESVCAGLDIGKRVEGPMLTSWEAGDPRLRFLTLDGVHVTTATELKAQGSGASLVRSSASTLIADASTPGRTVTILGFDVADSDWPLKASFVLFTRNVVELARLHRAQGAAGPSRTGEPLRLAVPAGTQLVTVEGPGMLSREVSAKLGFAVVSGIERAGFYRLRWTSPRVGDALVAANLTSERESDIRPRPVLFEAGAATTTTAKAATESHNEWGSWLALLAAAVIAFDVWWLTRPVRVPVLTGSRSGVR